LVQAVSAFHAVEMIGLPECNVVLAQCCVYLARAPKSIAVYEAYEKVKALVHKAPSYPVPLHLRNPTTKLNRDLGYGEDYKYNPHHDGPVDQQYFPEELIGTKFFNPDAVHRASQASEDNDSEKKA
jgi:putative ATPase